jgi:Rad3-related DNA helicase
MTLSVISNVDQVPQPPVFGFHAWLEWRPRQWEAVNQICDMEPGILGLNCPTGFGKSLTYIAAAVLSERRTVVLTGTKALQDQLNKDFSADIAVLKGRNAYPCLSGGKTADDGPCAHNLKCYERDRCHYRRAIDTARKAPLVVTNYACWFAHLKHSDGLGDVDLLVCDEAHSVQEWLDWVSREEIRLGHQDLDTIPRPADPDEWRLWAEWAAEQINHVEPLLDEREAQLKRFEGQELEGKEKDYAIELGRAKRRAEYLLTSLYAVAAFDPDLQVLSLTDKNLILQQVQTHAAFQHYLADPAEYLVLTSATISPKTLQVLGLSEPDYTWAEYPTPFDLPARNPLVHIPTIRLNHRTDGNGKALWLSRIEQILRRHPEERGIVHTVSYARAKFILQHTRQQRFRMITHMAKDLVDRVMEFKASRRPLVLLSPSLGTGHDFPGDTCRFQVVSKVPYPDTRDRLLKRRAELDPDYISHLAMTQLVQICGRGMRSADDHCTNYIIDDNISWFIKRYAQFAPNWFLTTFRQQRTL